jgi:hypothetical protein
VPTNYAAAIKELFSIVNSVWVSQVTPLLAYQPQLRWQGVSEPTNAPTNQYWARVSTQNVSDTQATLSDYQGRRRYTSVGLLYVQLFCPKANGASNSVDLGRTMADLLRNAFRRPSPSGTIFFTNQRIVELAPTPDTYPINIIIRYQYDIVSETIGA